VARSSTRAPPALALDLHAQHIADDLGAWVKQVMHCKVLSFSAAFLLTVAKGASDECQSGILIRDF